MRAEDHVVKITRPHMQYQFVRKQAKQTVHLAVPNSDTLVNASVTVYQIHIDEVSPVFFKAGPRKHSNSRTGHLA